MTGEQGAPQAARLQRGARLSRSLSGTNLERAGDYNLRTVLQAIRLAGETTRVEIAHQTGLTAPAIANITTRLIEMGLVRTAGRRQGGRGQPAFKLQVNADGAFGIGLNIDRDHLTVITLDLCGQIRSRATREIAFAMPEDVQLFVRDELERLLLSGRVDRDRILGAGVAIPDDLGRIRFSGQPVGYEVWNDIDLAAMLGMLPWPIYSDNDAAAAALGEAQHHLAYDNPNFFYLLISAGLGGGLVIDRIYHRGANGRSGEIGLMPDASGADPTALVQDIVSTSALLHRLRKGGFAATCIADLTAMDKGAADVVAKWMDDAVQALKAPLIAINCLFNPDTILIGGRLPLHMIEQLAKQLNQTLENVSLPSLTEIRPAAMAQDAPACGAAILPFLDQVLPSDAILIQAGRDQPR